MGFEIWLNFQKNKKVLENLENDSWKTQKVFVDFSGGYQQHEKYSLVYTWVTLRELWCVRGGAGVAYYMLVTMLGIQERGCYNNWLEQVLSS